MLAALLVVACDREPADLPIAADTPQPTPTIRSMEEYESKRATAIAQAEMLHTPTPTPRRPGYPCQELHRELAVSNLTVVGFSGYTDHHLQWTPDGERLVFNENNTNIRVVDAQGSEIRTIVNMYPGRISSTYGLHLDLSPDGSRIVYSSCEYDETGRVESKSGSGQSMVLIDSFGRDGSGYELASIGIDGTSPRRLTDNDHMDHYPAWSPDGTRIAFIEGREYDANLSMIPADVFEAATPLVSLNEDDLYVHFLPPVWSPDGEFLAFVAEVQMEDGLSEVLLHTVRSDGSDLTRIGPSTALPVWSPESGELTFARTDELDGSPEKGEASIYSVRPDGTGMRKVWSSGPRPYDRYPLILQLSWSPDGSELLFLYFENMGVRYGRYFGVYSVNADGSGLRSLAPFETFVRAEWSPDGSRIAILDLVGRAESGTLIMMTPETGDVRLLARADRVDRFNTEGRFQVLSTPRLDVPVDASACAEGLVVPEPEANPGLVQDCETLLTIRDVLSGDADLDWDGHSPMEEWEGVTIECCPSRVSELSLADHGLTGVIPPEIGQMASLVSLDLSSNWLTGAIPTEIGQLTELESLDLSENWLTGAIPPELGWLRLLRLGRNYLSGGIPPELGSHGMLEELYLNNNFLTGSIPAQLGRLSRLKELYIQNNNLSGNIPPELGGLTALRRLSHYNHQLEGCIPAKLWDMEMSNRLVLEDQGRSELQPCEADS